MEAFETADRLLDKANQIYTVKEGGAWYSWGEGFALFFVIVVVLFIVFLASASIFFDQQYITMREPDRTHHLYDDPHFYERNSFWLSISLVLLGISSFAYYKLGKD